MHGGVRDEDGHVCLGEREKEGKKNIDILARQTLASEVSQSFLFKGEDPTGAVDALPLLYIFSVSRCLQKGMINR